MTGIRTSDGVWLDLAPDAEFELTIENPLLRDDRTPSSWSTDITFPPTTLNKRVFGYLGALMTEPSVKRLGATIASGGLRRNSRIRRHRRSRKPCLHLQHEEPRQ